MHSGILINNNGARPSPGAATPGKQHGSECSAAASAVNVAVTGDGRAPKILSAGSVVERAHAEAETADKPGSPVGADRTTSDSEAQLEELLEQIQSLPDPVARDLAMASVQSVLDLYGRGLQ